MDCQKNLKEITFYLLDLQSEPAKVSYLAKNPHLVHIWSLGVCSYYLKTGGHTNPYYILMNGNGTQILRLDQYLIDRGRVQADGQGR